MKLLRKIYQLIPGLILLFSCEEPYTPTYEPEDISPILIIEGYIDMSGNSRFKLSQTVPLNSEQNSAPIQSAVLSIESEDNQIHSLNASSASGEYVIQHTALHMGTRYRLRVKTGSKEYLSEWVTPYATSEIGEIDHNRTDSGIELLVSTVNPNQDLRYYRWEFEETWKFSAKYISFLIFDQGQVRLREQPEENISMCFNRATSSEILIASSESLSENSITRQKIQLIPNLSEKLMYRYSILVKQHNISKESYIFWSILKKNSESVGDIFGSMPSELKGNVFNVSNPNEPVIAMIEASLPTQKRIYYDAQMIRPPWQTSIPFYAGCESFIISVEEAPAFFRSNSSYSPIHELFQNPASAYPTHYAYTTKECTECTRLGFLNAPDFWTDND